MTRVHCFVIIAGVAASTYAASPRDFVDRFTKSADSIFDKARDELKKIDPTVKDSKVREILRDFDSDAIRPVVDALKKGVVPPLFQEYLADLERQARGRKKSLPEKFRGIVASHYKGIDLEKVQYAEDIDTWHGAAITVGDTIYFPVSIDLENKPDVHWMLHELEHVTQYDKAGGVSAFLLKYFVQGGIRALNNGSFNVHDDIGLERDAENKADRIIDEVAAALNAPVLRPSLGPHIIDLKIIAGDHPWVPVPRGYFKDPIDLNWGAKGKYVYLCIKRGTGAGISDIDVISGDKANIRPESGFEKDGTDLNWGSGGKYIYLTVRKGNEDLVRDIKIVASDDEKVDRPGGYRGGRQDLNEGADGKYIYLFFRR